MPVHRCRRLLSGCMVSGSAAVIFEADVAPHAVAGRPVTSQSWCLIAAHHGGAQLPRSRCNSRQSGSSSLASRRAAGKDGACNDQKSAAIIKHDRDVSPAMAMPTQPWSLTVNHLASWPRSIWLTLVVSGALSLSGMVSATGRKQLAGLPEASISLNRSRWHGR